MSGSICFINMIHHNMVDKVDRLMRGKEYKGEGIFCHDALTLMMCKKRKAYMMCEHNLLKYWLILLEDLQQGT
jgi:hypothetical protein